MPARDNPLFDAYKYASRHMNKPSERIVVFVSPAQKRAIATTAEELGISVSELMRRAVLNFGATSEQVKAASIVDRLRVPREPDALDAALQRVARSAKANREALPAALRSASATAHTTSEKKGDGTPDPHRDSVAQPQRQPVPVPARIAPMPAPAPLDPFQALAALAAETADVDTHVDEALRAAEAQAAAEAAARVAAAKAATLNAAKSPSKSKRAASTSARDENPFIDPTEGTGRFA
jgi:hypothetical protein